MTGDTVDDGTDAMDRMKATPREAIGTALAAVAATIVAGTPESQNEVTVKSRNPRMPAIFLPHGGGPWPWMEVPFISREEKEVLTDYLVGFVAELPRPPRALLVVSAHWEAQVPTVMTNPRPPLFYDYGGFPAEMYRIQWPAAGEPVLASRVRRLLEANGFETAEDPKRGFDHGTFVPLKLTFPNANVPTIQLSLERGLDPERHLAIGRALAPLLDEDVLLVGSGMSFHNVRHITGPLTRAARAELSEPFDSWLRETVVADRETRDAELARWAAAPNARVAHPREEHLMPLMVIAGAAGQDRGRIAFSERFAGMKITAVHFGARLPQEA